MIENVTVCADCGAEQAEKIKKCNKCGYIGAKMLKKDFIAEVKKSGGFEQYVANYETETTKAYANVLRKKGMSDDEVLEKLKSEGLVA